MLDTIRTAWGWVGLHPVEVVMENTFGNVIVRATDGVYWRICPEELRCERMAHDAAEFVALAAGEEFDTDWEMAPLVELARRTLGPLPDGQCYCLKIPGVLGGEYVAGNLGINSRLEVLAFAGDLAKQIRDLPDGSQIQLVPVP